MLKFIQNVLAGCWWRLLAAIIFAVIFYAMIQIARLYYDATLNVFYENNPEDTLVFLVIVFFYFAMICFAVGVFHHCIKIWEYTKRELDAKARNLPRYQSSRNWRIW